MSVKVRIAPSPTGNLHIGTARTALFNWLFAKHHGGEFIVRIEDTDLERSDKKFEQSIIDGLSWLGIKWDGQIYHQSERLSLYKRYLQQLLESGKAFWCHHSKEELETEKKEQLERKEPPRHICTHKGTPLGSQPGELIRLVVDQNSEREISFKDSVRGEISWQERLIDDISLAKNLDTPLYNFAVVVDDIEMQISHVIRGEDHISNTPKQLLIYEALGKTPPEFAHLSLILGPDKSKLSKRHGAMDVMEYAKEYLPEALINFIGFLGYTYSKEILSKEEMAQEFEINKVHKSGAVFDHQKLDWINAQYIKRLSAEQLGQLTGIKVSDAALPLITERLERLSQVHDFNYLWQKPEYDGGLLIWKKSNSAEVKEFLAKTRQTLSEIPFNKEEIQKALDQLGGQNRGLVYWPLRVALSGKEKSPDPVDIALVISKEETLKRIDDALAKL